MEHYKHFHRIILMVVLQGWFPGSYSQDSTITLPKSIRALRGSCVEIPCSFIHSVDLDYVNLIWYKKLLPYDEIIFDQYFSSQIYERYRGRTSLVVNETNSCSLRINDVQETGTYYPYIHGNCDDITDCQTVKVYLSDVPNKPSIQIPSSLKEEESVSISCSVEHTCPSSPPSLRWNKDGYNLTATQEKLKDGVWKVDTVMAYLPSYQDHGTTLECEATYPNGLKSQHMTTLNIKFSPKNIRVVMFEGKKEVKESDEIRLICTSDANPAANDFIWYNNKRNETEELREEHGQNIINVTVGWDREKFSCTARNPLGEGKSGVLELQVLYESVYRNSAYIILLAALLTCFQCRPQKLPNMIVTSPIDLYKTLAVVMGEFAPFRFAEKFAKFAKRRKIRKTAPASRF
ncbi:hypothetical protein XELAEV_18004274mg [Xenopus laevis]|uniref:Ig-like domain-containing protein n=1 Tax=Xenopus laevis TaxID=8355 RepID=A0A974BRL2_XENLA|nr:hypothetical protein XELAEV_18004274mg [Xenopus laevis]